MSEPVTLAACVVVEELRSADSRPRAGAFTITDAVVRSMTLADLIQVLEGMGAETLEAWLSEDPEFGDDLWALPVEKRGVYLVLPLPTPQEGGTTMADLTITPQRWHDKRIATVDGAAWHCQVCGWLETPFSSGVPRRSDFSGGTMRATQLSVPEFRLLNDWAEHVVDLFRGEVPYLVGSVLERSDYRDIDVRLILDDADYLEMTSRIDIQRFGAVLSMWGWRVTGGLNIDFQVQQMTEANESYHGRRHALGLRLASSQGEGE